MIESDSGRLTGSRPSDETSISVEFPPIGFDPERVGGVTAPDYDPAYEASLMLPRLTAEQRDFIMRAKPHRRDQYLTKRDWNTVEPCVELLGWPPYTVWFGGMRANAGPGIRGWKRTFRFNPAGLLVHDAIAAGTRSAETSETSAPSEGCQSGGSEASASPKLQNPSRSS